MKKVFASIGECMVEMSSADDGLYRRGFGGDTFNTAWTLRAITDPETRVRYVTALGDDTLSDDLYNFIAAAGIEPAVSRVPGRAPGLYMITLKGYERSFSYWRDNSAARQLAEDGRALVRALEGVDCAYFSGITLAILPPAHRQTLLAVLGAVRERGGIVAFDPNIRPRLWPDRTALRVGTEAGYRAATIALPTYPDEQELFGDPSIEACAQRCSGYGVSEVVLKNGAEPALAFANGTAIEVAPERVAHPVDTTGAGDGFNAGYLAARLNGASPLEAARRGHRVAARVIQAHGGLVDMTALGQL